MEYLAEWPRVFEREAAAILTACRPWVTEVHHIGSTSVPGLAAKPILDVLPVAAGPAEGLHAVSRMTALGYRYRGENGIAGRFYFDRIVDGRTVMHVHMFPTGHPEVQRHLVFRDHLRNNTDAAREYERLKRELASAIPGRPPRLHRREGRLHHKRHRRRDARRLSSTLDLPSRLRMVAEARD